MSRLFALCIATHIVGRTYACTPVRRKAMALGHQVTPTIFR